MNQSVDYEAVCKTLSATPDLLMSKIKFKLFCHIIRLSKCCEQCEQRSCKILQERGEYLDLNIHCFVVRGCSHIMSAKNGGPDSPPLVSKISKISLLPCQKTNPKLAYLPPPCHKSYLVAFQLFK